MSTGTQAVPVITVDGPSGVGKGTVSRLLALRLGWHMLDSGSLYRLTALAARRRGIDLADEAAVAVVAAGLPVQFVARADAEAEILLADEPVNALIRTEEAGSDASRVAALPAVRVALLDRQRAFRTTPGLVADGRDMGTTIFPDAPAKLFLTATPEVRAERRYKQLREKGISVNLTSLVEEIAQRDQRDSSRAVSPLRPADDAVVIDTSLLDIGEVLARAIAVCGGRLGFY